MATSSNMRLSLVAGAVGLGLLMAPAVSTAAPGGGPRFSPAQAVPATRTSRSRATAGTTSQHYDLDLTYTPPAPEPAPLTGELEGVATIALRATQDLDRFNLDLRGLDVHRITVDGKRATEVAPPPAGAKVGGRAWWQIQDDDEPEVGAGHPAAAEAQGRALGRGGRGVRRSHDSAP